VGVAALALRLFDALVALTDRFVRRRLSPPLYLTVSLLRQRSGRFKALWVMLVVTAGLGIYGAAFARTLDRDLVAEVRYRVGADVTLRPLWEHEVISVGSDGLPQAVIWREPPAADVQGLPGVQATARVQKRRDLKLFVGTRNVAQVTVMGIEPQTFGQVTRFYPELSPASPAAYLNALAQVEQGALVSSDLARRVGLKPGDRVTVRQEEFRANLVVVGLVPYWPGLGTRDLLESPDFVVANLPYLQDRLSLVPYDYWLRLEPGAPLLPLAQTLRERGVRLSSWLDSPSELAAGRREPFRLGVYATLSLGFLVAVVVMMLTYLLSVGLTLQARTRELGVLRAMGMTARQVAGALYLEQLVQMGSALAVGLMAGVLVAAVYVPWLRHRGEPALPLAVAPVTSDRVWLLLGFGLALVTGLLTVMVWLRRLQVTRAIRLGEDE
jgi:putative ABC transport system permease protein